MGNVINRNAFSRSIMIMSSHKFCLRQALVIALLGISFVSSKAAFCHVENPARFAVIAYFRGDSSQANRYPVDELTHICYSFLHLRGDRLAVDNAKDSLNIVSLIALKKKHPHLKILLSLGGWGGCKTCSDVFSSERGRSVFAESTLEILQEYNADGIDLDWEYPSVEGYPGHRFSTDDRHNFTLLVRQLRKTLANRYEITFAAGATTTCLEQSIEWNAVVPYVDRIHLMTYDFTNGFSKVTGHHTPLYSTPDQPESSDRAVRYLDSLGVPGNKIALGLAFYARVWSDVDSKNHGLYRTGTFLRYVGFRDFDAFFGQDSTFTYYWDSTAQAPFRYSSAKHLFATFDDKRSVALKVDYALAHHLAGVMFWELTGDTWNDGLVDTIGRELHTEEERTGNQ